MKMYLITFNDKEVLTITPVSGGHILGCCLCLIASLQYAKLMLQAIGIKTSKLDDYVEPELNDI